MPEPHSELTDGTIDYLRQVELHPYTAHVELKSKRWKQLRIIPRSAIGVGSFSTTILVDVPVSNAKTLHFVVKRPHPTSCSSQEFMTYYGIYSLDEMQDRITEEHAVTQVESEINNYKLAKRAGLKVFNTMRELRGPYGAELLMTTGSTNEWICLGDTGDTSILTTYGLQKLTEIDNFADLVAEVFSQSEIAYHYGITFDSDAFFFLVNKQNPSKVDFVLGDVGCLEKKNNDAGFKSVWLSNLERSERALVNFLNKNMEPSIAEHYIEKVRKQSQNISKENQLRKPERLRLLIRDLRKFLTHDPYPALTYVDERSTLVYK